MASAVGLRADYSATDLRRLAAASKNANQSRRPLSLAAGLDGMDRTGAGRGGAAAPRARARAGRAAPQPARRGGRDRQAVRAGVHRFKAQGPDGLLDGWSKGPEPRLSA